MKRERERKEWNEKKSQKIGEFCINAQISLLLLNAPYGILENEIKRKKLQVIFHCNISTETHRDIVYAIGIVLQAI